MVLRRRLIKRLKIIFLIAAFAGSACAPPPKNQMEQAPQDDFALDFSCLAQSYPGLVQERREDADGKRWIIVSGRPVLYDDANKARDSINNSTIKDSMAQPYPLEPDRPKPPPGFHPGRVRSYELLGVIYGKNRQEIEAQTTKFPLAGNKSIKLSGQGGLPQSFMALNSELEALLEKKPDLKPYVARAAGGYVYRVIKGEQRLSPHSYGMAIDLNPQKGPYWQWSKGETHPAQLDYPGELVSLFEKHGFIWGGKWREYDLMHFEYRPELVCKAIKLRQKAAQ